MAGKQVAAADRTGGLNLGTGPSGTLQMEDDAGAGLSGSAADNIVPLVYKLQPLSPQVNPRNNEFIDGAQPGDIWIRNSAMPIAKGPEGFLFQPCHFHKEWVEWQPNRGGFVGRHDNREDTSGNDVPAAEGARQVVDPQNPKRMVWKLNDNDLVLTRNHAGNIVGRGAPQPYMIPMTGASHTVSRMWMSQMRTMRTPGGKEAASWACAYKMTTKPKSNAQGDWFEWSIEHAGWFNDPEDYARGKALHEAFKSGEKRGADLDAGGESGSSDDTKHI